MSNRKNKIGMFANMTSKATVTPTVEPKTSVTNDNEEIMKKFSVKEETTVSSTPVSKDVPVEETKKVIKNSSANPLADEKKSLGIKADVWVKVNALLQVTSTGSNRNVNSLLESLIDDKYDSLNAEQKKQFDENVKALSNIELQKIKLKKR